MRKIIIAILILIFAFLIGRWLFTDPTSNFTVSNPGMDSNSVFVTAMQNIVIGEFFELFEEKTPEMQDSWTMFRGANHDNIVSTNHKLVSRFPKSGPQILWKSELGEGHAGAAIYKGLVYIIDYDEEQKADMVRCFTLEEGKEVWRRWYKVSIKRNHGISRTVPAVSEKYILSMGPKCHMMCMNRTNGDLIWSLDISKDYESEIPLWYTGQCPLIDNDIAIIATGGKALLIGIDCATGKKIWETPNPDKWKMSHASIMPFTFEGKEMYVYAAIGGLCGISAEGDDIGQVLWKTKAWDHSVVSPSAVCMPDGKIFLTAGYGAGSMVCQLNYDNGHYSVNVLQEYKPRDGLASEQQTPIYFKGHLFGILPKDAGGHRNQLVCVDPIDCTKMVWSSGKKNRFGLGPYIIADNKLYLLNDDGTLFIIKADTKSYIQYDEFKLIDGVDAWAPIAVADGYMVLRDSKTMLCINMSDN